MMSHTTKADSSQPTAEMAVDLFDNWFDPIETAVRARAREFIEELIRGELDTVLARPRYGRSQMAGDEESADVTGHRHGSRPRSLIYATTREDIEDFAAKPSSASGGSNTALSPTAWRRPATGSLPSPVCRRASGAAHEQQMQSSGCTKSSSEGSKPRPCCRRQTPPPCCSGRCSHPVRSTCAGLMAGRRSQKTLSVSQLTLPPETIASCYWRSRHQIPTAFRTAPRTSGVELRQPVEGQVLSY